MADNSTDCPILVDAHLIFKYAASIVAIAFNLLIIVMILKFKNLQNIPNIFIFNLAVLDCINGVFYFGNNVWRTFYCFSPSYTFCVIYHGLELWKNLNIVYVIVILSLDRYFAIVHCISSKVYRTKKSAKCVCFLTFIASGIVSIPIWVHTHILEWEGINYCQIGLFDEYYKYYMFSLNYAVPLIAIILCYVLIVYAMASSQQIEQNNTTRKSSKRVLILAISIVLSFVILFSPFYIAVTFTDLQSDVHAVVVGMLFSHSVINPVLYTFIGQNFKKNLLKMWCCVKFMPCFSRFAHEPASSFRTTTTTIRHSTIRSNSKSSQDPDFGKDILGPNETIPLKQVL
ncbi:somatostatin receptor type 2-like [Antedon mediterranea]|uniref:somatostatin receptor type 2-like n=1 Tax=Antedon mediterranea TaxID=105859 RepID=UPI003AF704C4